MVYESLPPIEEVPAAHLEGRELSNGWSVGKRIAKDSDATGGHYSYSYVAIHQDGREAFMKALNFRAAASGPGSIVDRLNDFTSAFRFERDLLADCCDRKMSRVIKMIDHGEVNVPEASALLSEVPYLIFELADGDIRFFQALSTEFDCAWVFRVIKHTLQGVGQLHAAHAAHQDLKPSNVLTQGNGREMKLGDLGNAERRETGGPRTQFLIPGAVAYAPPEQHYGAFTGAWEERQAADLYLAGSLGAQLFIGNSMSVMIQQNLPQQFRLRNWAGSFSDVLPYLRTAHNTVIEILEHIVFERTGDTKDAELFAIAIGQMTDPDLSMRGHPKDRAASTSSFEVQRYVSRMDLLSRRAHYRYLREQAYGRTY